MVIFVRLLAFLCLVVAFLTAGGCELIDDDCDSGETLEELARIMNEKSGVYVGGDAISNELDTVDAPVIIGGNAVGNDVNTAAEQ